jgi:hypothetical protein
VELEKRPMIEINSFKILRALYCIPKSVVVYVCRCTEASKILAKVREPEPEGSVFPGIFAADTPLLAYS